MKLILLFPLLAISISPVLSQPRSSAIDNIPQSAPLNARSDSVDVLCQQVSEFATDQLAEITRLQSRNLPVPPDLGGYFFALVSGRKMFGCPSDSLLSSNGSSSSASSRSKRSSSNSSSSEALGDPCEVVRTLHEQVMDPMGVLKDNTIPVPGYLAGWYSLVQDSIKFLKCEISDTGAEGVANSTDASSGDTNTE